MRTIRKNVLAVALGMGLGLAGLAGANEGAAPEGAIDYPQLGAILGYVATDYPTAVGPNGILSPQEYSEQQGFLGDALELLHAAPKGDELRTLVESAATSAAQKAPPDTVVPAVKQALALLEEQHGVSSVPKAAPSFAQGQSLFHAACEDCHAANGSGHTALKLSTLPPDFTDAKDRGPLSPSRVFNAVSYGVPRTAMPAFREAYSETDRWNLAFYVMALGHAGAPVARPAPRNLPLADLAQKTDDELAASTGVGSAIAWLRTQGPYAAPATPGTALLNGARQLVAEAVKQAQAGDAAGARHAAIAAYLDDFEPFEAVLNAKDAALTRQIESDFLVFRENVAMRAPIGTVQDEAAEIERLLQKAQDAVATASASVSFAASLAIILREGLEAALLLSAMLALATKSGRPRARLSVHLGWSAALLGGGVTWFLTGAVLAYGGQRRELTEGITVLVTAALLLGASHWLFTQSSAKRIAMFLANQSSLIRGAGWAIGLFAFFAIYREMFEIVIFYRSLLLQAAGQERAVALGLGVGLLALVGLVVVFQRVVGHKLKPRPLLLTCGALLCALSVVMVGEGVRSLQEAAVLGQHLLHFPEVPQLGIFATAEGLTAQLLVIVGLAVSLGYSLTRAVAPPQAQPNGTGARA